MDEKKKHTLKSALEVFPEVSSHIKTTTTTTTTTTTETSSKNSGITAQDIFSGGTSSKRPKSIENQKKRTSSPKSFKNEFPELK